MKRSPQTVNGNMFGSTRAVIIYESARKILHLGGADCVLRIKEVKNKTPNLKYTNRLDLQILDVNDTSHAVPGAIILETPFIGIPHSTQPTLRFYAIPCTKNQDISLTIMISIIAI